MRRLAGLDRLLDLGQHLSRKNPPHPPLILDKVLADALDAHNYQLPEAPPPPKLPPLPEKPLSLEPELDPPDHEPPEEPEDQPPPPRPALRLTCWLAARMPSPNIVRKNAMTPKTPETTIEPSRNQKTAPITPAVTPEPSSRPRRPRMIPAIAMKPIKPKGLKMMLKNMSGSTLCDTSGFGTGNGSPSTIRMMRSTPAEIPPVKSPVLKRGTMISSMMRRAVTSGSAPSRP